MTTLKRRALIAGPIAALLAATLLAGTPAAAETREPADPYGRLVIAALDTCHAQGAGRTYDSMTTCVGDLATPDPYVPFQVDLWDVVRECLYLYYKGLDSLDPEFADVNKCLERHGYDVGLP